MTELQNCTSGINDGTSQTEDHHHFPSNLSEQDGGHFLTYLFKNSTNVPYHFFAMAIPLKCVCLLVLGYLTFICLRYIKLDHPVYANVFQTLVLSIVLNAASFVLMTIATIAGQNIFKETIVFEVAVAVFTTYFAQVNWTVVIYLRAHILVIKADSPDIDMKFLKWVTLLIPWCAVVLIMGVRLFFRFCLQLSDTTIGIIGTILFLLPLFISFILNRWTEKELFSTVKTISPTQKDICQGSSAGKGASSHFSKVTDKDNAEPDEQASLSSSIRSNHNPTMSVTQQQARCHISSRYSVRNSEVTLNVPDLWATQDINEFDMHHAEVSKEMIHSYISLSGLLILEILFS